MLKGIYKYVKEIVDNLRKIAPVRASEDAYVELHFPLQGEVELSRIRIYSIEHPFTEYVVSSRGITAFNQETYQRDYLIDSTSWNDLREKLQQAADGMK